jgi:hypothetical protein
LLRIVDIQAPVMVFGYWKRTSVELLTGCLDLDFGPFRPNLFGQWR